MNRDSTKQLDSAQSVGLVKMATDESYSCVDSLTGKAVAVFGVEKYRENRGEVWLVSQTKTAKESLGVYRILKIAIEKCPISRLECIVRFDNASGHKLVSSLGFTAEALQMKKFLSDGSDATLYSYVKD